MTDALLTRAIEMRNAIDALENALMAPDDFVDLPRIFEGSPDALVLRPAFLLLEVRRICKALSECTRIINSEDYSPDTLAALISGEEAK